MTDTNQNRVQLAGLDVDETLATFLETLALPGTGIDADTFWDGLAGLISDMGPKNAAFLAKRADIQAELDVYHIERRGTDHDAQAYQQFLTEIGYLVPERDDFAIETANVDPEMRKHRGASVGCADQQRTLRVECCERAVGQHV